MLWCLCGRSREERKFRLAAGPLWLRQAPLEGQRYRPNNGRRSRRWFECAENVATGTVIDRVRRTELAGKRKPLLIYVYGNDGVTAGDLCCHKGR